MELKDIFNIFSRENVTFLSYVKFEQWGYNVWKLKLFSKTPHGFVSWSIAWVDQSVVESQGNREKWVLGVVGRQAARELAIMKSLQAFKPLFDVIQRPLLPLLLLKPEADDKV